MSPRRTAKDGVAHLQAVVLDADRQQAATVLQVLAELGYNAHHAETSEAALRTLQHSPSQLLVINDATPSLGALAMIAMAQPLLAPIHTAVIVLGRQDKGGSGLSGVTFVAPPFGPDDLREAVHAASWMRDLASEEAAKESRSDSPQGIDGVLMGRKRFKSTLSFQPQRVRTVSTSLTLGLEDEVKEQASLTDLHPRAGGGRPVSAAIERAEPGPSVTQSAAAATTAKRRSAMPTQAETLASEGNVGAPSLSPLRNGEPDPHAPTLAHDRSPTVRKGGMISEPLPHPTAGPTTRPASTTRQAAPMRPVSSGHLASPSAAELSPPTTVQRPLSQGSALSSLSSRSSSSAPSGPSAPAAAPATISRPSPRTRKTTILPEHLVIADRYELRGVLGTGGMAVVYRAHDRELDEDVALKLLKEDRGDESSLARFKHELRICRRLQHPAIVQTFEFGVWERRRFLTMELLDGTDLARLIQERKAPMELLEGVQLFAQAARGLDAAHRAGVIHRDVKPHNLFMMSDGQRLKIMDFGIAKSEALSQTMTNAEHVLGTPAYLAPERLRDKVELSASTDLYSLAVAMYQTLSCKLPFTGPDISSLLTSILMDDPKPLRELRPEVPEVLDTLILRCLARQPEDRPPSCGVLAEELEDVGRSLRRAWA